MVQVRHHACCIPLSHQEIHTRDCACQGRVHGTPYREPSQVLVVVAWGRVGATLMCNSAYLVLPCQK